MQVARQPKAGVSSRPHLLSTRPRLCVVRSSTPPQRDSPTCSDLAGVVDSIGTAQGDPLSQKPPPIPAAGSSTSTNPGSTVPPQQPANTPPPPSKKEYDARYYSGFFTTDIKQDNNANVTDNLVRNLKLAGGLAGVLVLLLLGFMASNGLLTLPNS